MKQHITAFGAHQIVTPGQYDYNCPACREWFTLDAYTMKYAYTDVLKCCKCGDLFSVKKIIGQPLHEADKINI